MRRALLFVLGAALVSAGCGDDGGKNSLVAPSGQTTGDDGGDTGDDTGGDTTTTGEDTTLNPNVLRFENAVDSTGQACTNPCLQVLGIGITQNVAIKYNTADGSPVAEAAISFETDAPDAMLQLSAKQVFTNGDGRAVLGLTGKPGAEGSFNVTIRAPDDASATPIVLQVLFDVELVPPLQIDLNYIGTQSIQSFDVLLYLQEGGKPICSDVHPDATNPPTPVMLKQGIGLTETTTIEGLPGLDEAGAQQWLVQVRGPSNGAVAVNGCTAGVEVKAKETRQVTVDVVDLPQLFMGPYDIKTNADMHTGLPGTAGDIIDLLVGLFTEPGTVALEAACKNADGLGLETICALITSGDGSLNALGLTAAEIGTVAFFELMKAQIGDGNVFSGQSLAGLLEEMRFGSVMTLNEEPSLAAPAGLDGGMFAPGTIHELWETVSYRWLFIPGCDASDPEACWQTVKLLDIYGITLEADTDGGVTAEQKLWVTQHTVPGFNYGTLVSFLVEKKIMPLLFGDGTDPGPNGDFLPAVDTYAELIATIFGDGLCLYYNDCCEWFAQKQQVKDITDTLPFGGDAAATALCQAAVSAGAAFITSEVAKLGGTLSVGTPDGQPCWTADQQSDRLVDTLGDKSNPCTWNMSIDVSGGTFTPINDWHGLHK